MMEWKNEETKERRRRQKRQRDSMSRSLWASEPLPVTSTPAILSSCHCLIALPVSISENRIFQNRRLVLVITHRAELLLCESNHQLVIIKVVDLTEGRLGVCRRSWCHGSQNATSRCVHGWIFEMLTWRWPFYSAGLQRQQELDPRVTKGAELHLKFPRFESRHHWIHSLIKRLVISLANISWVC